MTGLGAEHGGTARAAARTVAFGAYSTLALGAYELERRVAPPEEQRVLLARYKRRVASDVLGLLGVDWRIDGDDVHETSRGRLVVSNHRTALDIGVLLAHFAGSMLSRADVARWPVLGVLATHAETIFVDRADRLSGARAIRQIRRSLEMGRTVVVFPEGTTLAGDEVRSFQAGAFAAARGLDVEITPVGLAYEPGIEWTGDVGFASHLGAIARRPRTRVVGVVGASFRPDAASSALAKRAHDAVQGLVYEARARYGR